MLVSYLSSGGNEQSWFKYYVEKAIQILLKNGVAISTSESKGGYLSVFKPVVSDLPPKMEYLIACGIFPKEKRSRYMYNSIEKATRLNDFIKDGHKTSRQSADVKNEEYPGAIFFEFEGRIFSFSGLEPQWDEFLSVLSGVFNYYLNRANHNFCEGLEDVPSLFAMSIHLITATEEEVEIMISTVEELVASEIELRDK